MEDDFFLTNNCFYFYFPHLHESNALESIIPSSMFSSSILRSSLENCITICGVYSKGQAMFTTHLAIFVLTKNCQILGVVVMGRI